MQAEEARQRDMGAEVAERDRRSADLRAQLENDAAILRRAQKAVDAERAAQKVHTDNNFDLVMYCADPHQACVCIPALNGIYV